MRTPPPPPDDDSPLLDVRSPGVARTIYIIVAVLVVISLVIGIAGYAWWGRIF